MCLGYSLMEEANPNNHSSNNKTATAYQTNRQNQKSVFISEPSDSIQKNGV